MNACELCNSPGGEILWEDGLCRVIRVAGGEGEGFPGYCRVVWRAHVAEMTDLEGSARRHLLHVVWAVEAALRSTMAPDKINLASLGNLVPHVHWHVIPRWRDDSHFPGPIWAAALRSRPARRPPDSSELRAAITAALAEEESGA